MGQARRSHALHRAGRRVGPGQGAARLRLRRRSARRGARHAAGRRRPALRRRDEPAGDGVLARGPVRLGVDAHRRHGRHHPRIEAVLRAAQPARGARVVARHRTRGRAGHLRGRHRDRRHPGRVQPPTGQLQHGAGPPPAPGHLRDHRSGHPARRRLGLGRRGRPGVQCRCPSPHGAGWPARRPHWRGSARPLSPDALSLGRGGGRGRRPS